MLGWVSGISSFQIRGRFLFCFFFILCSYVQKKKENCFPPIKLDGGKKKAPFGACAMFSPPLEILSAL